MGSKKKGVCHGIHNNILNAFREKCKSEGKKQGETYRELIHNYIEGDY